MSATEGFSATWDGAGNYMITVPVDVDIHDLRALLPIIDAIEGFTVEETLPAVAGGGC